MGDRPAFFKRVLPVPGVARKSTFFWTGLLYPTSGLLAVAIDMEWSVDSQQVARLQ